MITTTFRPRTRLAHALAVIVLALSLPCVSHGADEAPAEGAEEGAEAVGGTEEEQGEDDASAAPYDPGWTSIFMRGPHTMPPASEAREHPIPKGKLEIAYTFKTIRGDELLSGTQKVTTEEALEDYDASPTRLDRDEHWISLYYAPHSRITVSVHVPLIRTRMRHVRSDGSSFENESTGFGDLEFEVHTAFMRTPTQRMDASLTLVTPTGSIHRTGDFFDEPDRRLPYPLQLGTGTFALAPTLAYMGVSESVSWGGRMIATFRIGENSLDYRWGHRYEGSLWAAYEWLSWASTSIRLSWTKQGDLLGADASLDPSYSPDSGSRRQGGTRLDLGPGVNFMFPSAEAHRLGVEIMWPIYQDLSGPQVAAEWTLSMRWSYLF